MDELLLRRRMLNMFRDEYIVFADPNVEQICATNWGDGTKITKKQAAAVTNLGNEFQGNTTITSFDELSYFKNLSTLQNSEFNGCTSLTSIFIPESVTRIGNLAFSNTNISNFENANPCSYGTEVFKGSSLTRIKIKPNTSGATMNTFAGVGLNGETCDIIIDGDLTGNSVSASHRGNYRKLIILGNLATATIASYWGGNNEQLRTAGNCSAGSSIGILGANHSPFFEVMGDVTSTNKLFTRNSVNRIVHLGYNGVVTCDPTVAAFNFATKIYVGPGNSQAEDEAILNQYLANNNWSSFSSVLATWWSYKVSESANPDYLIPMDQL